MFELRTTVKNGVLIVPPFDFSSLEGLDLVLTIKRFRSQRSTSQNKLYWALLRQIASETAGDTSKNYLNILHDFFRGQFLPPYFIVLNGKTIETLGHTPDCNTKEFTEYLEKIIAYCAMELNLVINI